MKKITLIALVALFSSCNNPPKGTTNDVHSTDEIELKKYYYDEAGNYVFVARFKSSPNSTSTTWFERRGKQTVRFTVVLDDSINQPK